MSSLVSVIMPAYNAETTILSAINSVINQTISDWELIIVDDCSVDNSLGIIKKFCSIDNRIKLLSTEKNTGSPASPRNIGIQHAKGRFIAFCDSDDIWLPTKLEEQIPLFDDNTSIVFSNYEKIDTELNRNKRYIIAPKQATYNSLLNGNYIGNLTGVYDTEKVGKVYQQKVFHEDYIMWLEILKKGYIAKNTNTITALYRVSKDSFSSSKIKVLKWQWNIYRTILKCNLLESVYHFIVYAVKAFLKYIK